jgi:hypothetical protein
MRARDKVRQSPTAINIMAFFAVIDDIPITRFDPSVKEFGERTFTDEEITAMPQERQAFALLAQVAGVAGSERLGEELVKWTRARFQAMRENT